MTTNPWLIISIMVLIILCATSQTALLLVGLILTPIFCIGIAAKLAITEATELPSKRGEQE
jgi:hypothetical protein